VIHSNDGGGICSICSEYYSNRPHPRNNDGMFITKSFQNWKKSNGAKVEDNKLLKHHLSDGYRTAMIIKNEQLTMTTCGRSVYGMVHQQSSEQKDINLKRLCDFADAAYYLYKQEIPHTTHYENLLQLVARLDGSREIQKFMDSSPHNATYRSPGIATEFLESVSEWLRSDIASALRSSPFIAILADEATDLRVRSELSICFRNVSSGQAIESLFSLQRVFATDADTLSDTILTLLKKHDVTLHKIYWMYFDGVANMAGNKNGVQAKLKNDYKRLITFIAIATY